MAQEESFWTPVPEPFSHLHHMPPFNSHWPTVLWLTQWCVESTLGSLGSGLGLLQDFAP